MDYGEFTYPSENLTFCNWGLNFGVRNDSWFHKRLKFLKCVCSVKYEIQILMLVSKVLLEHSCFCIIMTELSSDGSPVWHSHHSVLAFSSLQISLLLLKPDSVLSIVFCQSAVFILYQCIGIMSKQENKKKWTPNDMLLRHRGVLFCYWIT